MVSGQHASDRPERSPDTSAVFTHNPYAFYADAGDETPSVEPTLAQETEPPSPPLAPSDPDQATSSTAVIAAQLSTPLDQPEPGEPPNDGEDEPAPDSESETFPYQPTLDKQSSILVVAEMGKYQYIAAKALLKDEAGHAVTPCGHMKRFRLRHKGGIAYYCCAECNVRYREISYHKLHPDQIAFLKCGGVPKYIIPGQFNTDIDPSIAKAVPLAPT